jgi:hypothetical protein
MSSAYFVNMLDGDGVTFHNPSLLSNMCTVCLSEVMVCHGLDTSQTNPGIIRGMMGFILSSDVGLCVKPKGRGFLHLLRLLPPEVGKFVANFIV